MADTNADFIEGLVKKGSFNYDLTIWTISRDNKILYLNPKTLQISPETIETDNFCFICY